MKKITKEELKEEIIENIYATILMMPVIYLIIQWLG